ncbi:glycoside hydrolase family 13 protein [Symbioplanes lichenis]|uniref:glycoside hydrolase family 13 protein n=1 Tax=Symbioplanes lichenis TaxID=1629072 RepID=UPI00273832FA|nr:alpha-amylase family glycosyl hydrolase [Actinoplanes lichenis]
MGTPSEWWRSAVIYQIYPRSFADSNGDGMGDLPGITARLTDLRELGVDAVWLSPFYRSPQHDAGYDVADYRAVDPRFGDLGDADKMIAEAKSLGLRVLVDLVPNHTSSDHEWFRAALAAAPGSPERERYIFRDGKGPDGSEPPNNWRSVFGGPAWERLADGQWYLHLFDVSQPDLNWDNPEVRAEFESILRFWLDRGVDGFRVDVAHGLVKDAQLADYGTGEDAVLGGLTPDDGTPPPMWDQEGVHEIYRQWQAVLNAYEGDRILVAEAWVQPADQLARYVRPDEMHQAFNFEYLVTNWERDALRAVIDRTSTANAKVGAPTTWVLSNHDVMRHASRFGFSDGKDHRNGIGADEPQPDAPLGLRRARAATLQMLGLPGSAYVYQGEELGLPEHTTMADDVREDPTWERSGHTERGRDGCRVPIPWEADAPSYGFGPTDASWLPQPATWAEYALDRQRDVPGSTYELYRTALRLRKQHDLGLGALTWVDGGDDVLAFRNGDLLVWTNYGATPTALPGNKGVLVSSEPLDEDGRVPQDVTVWARA